MVDFTKINQQTYAGAQTTYDMGLREYMISVYKYMAIALMLSGIVAYGVSSSPTLMQAIFGSPLQWLVILAPVIMAFFIGSMIMNFSIQGAQAVFYAYAGIMGVSLSSIFIMYTGESIARVFFITASVFGAMSLWGYTTKRDLTSFGSFLFMGLIGVVIASLVNIFLKSSMLYFITSLLGLFIFIGLTAWDVQRIKNTYYQVAGSGELASKVAIFGALNLYLDFINLFIHLLQFFGDRRS